MTDKQLSSLPIVPLHAVLFPGGPLPLRIFEPRYLDMVSRCMKEDSPFGICLISEGNEVGKVATPHEVGTIAKIEDWHMGNDGILGITVSGTQRYRINTSRVQGNKLTLADVSLFDEEPQITLPREYHELVTLLRGTIDREYDRYEKYPIKFEDATWVGNRLAELLPLKLSQKQYFLQLEDPLLRLERISAVLDHLDLAV